MNRLYIFNLAVFLFILSLSVQSQSDQNVVWGTYLGGEALEMQSSNAQVLGSALTSENEIILVGGTNIRNDFATPGAHQEAFGGSWQDGYIAKFSEGGQLLWCTYLGGSGTDYIVNVALGPNGEIAVVGVTGSPDGMATEGSFRPVYGKTSSTEQNEGFLSVFSPDGVLEWSTYFGGSGTQDLLNTVVFNDLGQIVVGGRTDSPNMASENAFQTSFNIRTGVLATFSSDGAMIKTTYFGNGLLGVEDLKIDSDGNILALIFAVGESAPTTPGAHMTEPLSENWSSVLTKFDTDLDLIWSTYHGTAESDQTGMMAIGPDDEIYLSGNSFSPVGMGTPGSFMETVEPVATHVMSNRADYLSRFSTDGVLEWSTYFSGSHGSQSEPPKITFADPYILMSGNTLSADLPIIGNPIQSELSEVANAATTGAGETYLVKFHKDGDVIWSTFFGTPTREYSGPVGFFPNGRFYYAGSSRGAGLPTTQGSHQPEWSGYGQDIFLFVFDENVLSVGTEMQNLKLLIYPNPAENHVYLDNIRLNGNPMRVEIHDLTGRRVLSQNISQPFLAFDLPAGLYVLTVNEGEGKIRSSKLLVR